MLLGNLKYINVKDIVALIFKFISLMNCLVSYV